MNPILLGRQVQDGLRDLVRSSFRISSPAFDGMIDRFLATPGSFLQGPWISVGMPFRQAEGKGEPFPEVPLGFHPHLHQEQAFVRLRPVAPRSTIVATGTGSGKTECYLWPILDACRQRKGEPGIKAIVIYPMNALATDQARRIARAIHEIPALDGVRCGIYADAEPQDASDAMSASGVITRRAAMRANPPDILLTNYKMLDYLLLRGQDRELWAQNGPATLRFLVVDELHTFDGAQGADLALLIRRLKDRLKVPAGQLACVGSSATLGSGPDAAQRLTEYAENLFGERFDADAVIGESRQTPGESLDEIEYPELPDPAAVADAVAQAALETQPQAALRLARLLLPDLDPADPGFDPALPAEPAAAAWRIELGNCLVQHIVVHRVLSAVGEIAGPAPLAEVVARLKDSRLFRTWPESELSALVEAVIALIAWARRGTATAPAPLFTVRVQFWAREMARMVATLPPLPDRTGQKDTAEATDPPQGPDLLHSDDLDELALRRTLPLVHCPQCGSTGHLGRMPNSGKELWAPLGDLYEEFFGKGGRLRLLYHEPVTGPGNTAGHGAVLTGHLAPDSLAFTAGPHGGATQGDAGAGAGGGTGTGGALPVWLYDPVTAEGWVDRTCPACGAPQGLQILGMRAARLTASLATTLFTSEQHEVADDAKPRVLMFSDSVQDAAQRAAVAEGRNHGTVLRKALFRGVDRAPGHVATLAEVVGDLPARLRSELGDADFVARFLAKDQGWRHDYQELCATGSLPAGRLADDVALRLGWEFFSDLTYRAHSSLTLESARLAVAEVDPARIAAIAGRLPAALEAHVAPEFRLPEAEARTFLAGLLRQMRRRGAVAHDYLVQAVRKAGPRGPNWYGAQAALGIRNLSVLPLQNPVRSPAPLPPTLRERSQGFDRMLASSAGNWHQYWADRFFQARSPLARSRYGDMYRKLFELCIADGLVQRVESAQEPKIYGWLLQPAALLVSTRPEMVACGTCARQEAVLPGAAVADQPCSRIGCRGTMQPMPDPVTGHGSAYLQALFRTGRNHRVVAREHTGILQADARRALENSFIAGEQAWDANLVSATPTLEMGIDIGDLSTLLLCSVPPEAANYVQRIGRAGRRDGNALNLTIATARPHDLEFWEAPGAMLGGEVSPPGVHLEAAAVLRRQAAAFTLDRFIAGTATDGDYGKVKQALEVLEKGTGPGTRMGAFPLDWIDFLQKNGRALAEAFIALLPEDVQTRDHLTADIRRWLGGSDDTSLAWTVREAFDGIARERDVLRQQQEEIDKERKRLQRLSPPPGDLQEQLDALKRNRGEISHTIRRDINDLAVLKFLTDRSLLPNYAFPEEGVKLKSIIARRQEEGAGRDAAIGEGRNLVTFEYVRPAAAALSELAPLQSFYADGREVEIDRLELQGGDIEGWRFCPSCAHTDREASAAKNQACPKCGDPMWSDLGAQAEAVQLRTVVAVTPEDKSAIRDADDRQSLTFDRRIFPAYARDSIESAWAVDPEAAALPFGYEFISACEFRDVNFGKRMSAALGQAVAGEKRRSEPFRICRKCGKLQKPARNNARNNPRRDDHQARCEAKAKNLPPDDWEARIYLMRRFQTEAIRIVMPMHGQADDDEIKSFVAGLELGMKRHFAGRIDHIRSTVVEERLQGLAVVRSLYLYDSVPGGSGYLRQMAEDPGTMKRVFALAASALRDCPCAAEEGRDGCYRCVKSYRAHFGPGEPRRDLALQMMEGVLRNWEHLRRAEGSIDDSIGAGIVESALEERFLAALRKIFGETALKAKLLEGARRAFQLTIKAEGGEALYWTVETQVQIDQRFPGLPHRRVDFLLSRAGRDKAKPIVVELDGWAYHAATTAKDLEDRLLMVRSGQVDAWSLNWDDLVAEPADAFANPLGDMKLGPAFEGGLEKLWSSAAFAEIHDERDRVKRVRTASSIDLLCARLRDPGEDLRTAFAIVARMAIGPGKALAALPATANLSADAQSFLAEAAVHGSIGETPLALHVGAPAGAPPGAFQDHHGYRFVLQAALPEITDAPTGKAGLTVWRGLWRLVNLLQAFRGFHVAFPGLDDLGTPAMSAAAEAAPEDAAWSEVAELLDPPFSDILTALQAAGAPVPDLVGEDLTVGDAVVGQVEIGWAGARAGICAEPFEVDGWTLVPVDPAAPPEIGPLIRTLLSALQGAA